MYALALKGREGVEDQLRAILADLEVSLGLAGYSSLDEIFGKADEILVRD